MYLSSQQLQITGHRGYNVQALTYTWQDNRYVLTQIMNDSLPLVDNNAWQALKLDKTRGSLTYATKVYFKGPLPASLLILSIFHGHRKCL